MTRKTKTIAITVSLIVLIILVISIVSIYSIGKYIEHHNWLLETYKTETYASETEYLEIQYHNDGNFGFDKKSKDGKHFFHGGADFISENTALFDGKNALPEVDLYYEFVFEGDTVTLYNYGELVDVYTKVHNSESSAEQ
ncbi:MAG: hypothetical protein J6S77_02805 [Clostridia bacterium]|nr:hypothetical protein [Clostridia bacterium]